MTTRGKITLVGSAFIVITSVVIAATILLHPSPRPTSVDATPSKSQPPSEPETTENTATDAAGEPFSAQSQEAIMQNAVNAAEAYVAQPLDEEPAARKGRLSQYFASDSPVIGAKPPVSSESYTTYGVTTLQSDWYVSDDDDTLSVIVYLKVNVNTGFDTREDHQTWVVGLKRYGDRWLSTTITKSDLPYIQGEGE